MASILTIDIENIYDFDKAGGPGKIRPPSIVGDVRVRLYLLYRV